MKTMITNGGPHPSDRWADMTTESILELIEVGEESATPEAVKARAVKRALRPDLFAIFNGHHERVQKHERGVLAKAKESMVTDTINVAHHMTIGQEVDALLAATPFAAHFARPEVRAVIHKIIGRDTANVMHIERRYHADRLAKGA